MPTDVAAHLGHSAKCSCGRPSCAAQVVSKLQVMPAQHRGRRVRGPTSAVISHVAARLGPSEPRQAGHRGARPS
eukprot:6472302-Pyramimonas_sp.AAC.1